MGFNKTIQMFIFDGNPNGRIMCELSNWNGRVYKISRNEILQFSDREDSENTGLYFLFGKNDENNDTIYIGEAEKLLTRIKQHLPDNEYWNECVVVTSKDNILNKAHAKFLENSFHTLAKNAGRTEVINYNKPTRSSVSEYDEAMLTEFISNTKLLVNILGYKTFDTIEETAIKHHNNKLIFSISAARGAEAKGMIVADGFAVLKNSKIAMTTTPSMGNNLIKLRETLLKKNIINQSFEFTKDYIFTSPSLAAAVVMGRNANGRTEWKTPDKKTLKSIEEDTVQ